MQALLALARSDESVRQEALPIFLGAVAHEDAPAAALTAARGVGLIAGAEEGRRAWTQLIERAPIEVAASCASVVDVSLAPVLLEALEKRQGLAIQVSFVRALGRLKHAPAFDAIVRRLGDGDVRPHAVEALGDLGDKRAVAHLTPLIADATEAWQEDNHGPMLRVSDLAKAAIAKLGGAVEAPALLRVAKAAAPAAVAPTPSRPRAKAAPFDPLVYLPLIAGLAAMPWFGVVAFAVLFTTGRIATNDAKTQTLDLIAIIPPAIGLLAAVIAIFRGAPRSKTETLCLVAGIVLCGVFAFSFGWEYLHPDPRR